MACSIAFTEITVSASGINEKDIRCLEFIEEGGGFQLLQEVIAAFQPPHVGFRQGAWGHSRPMVLFFISGRIGRKIVVQHNACSQWMEWGYE